VSNFIFNWANSAIANATLNLSSNYYAHLVTTVPAFGHSTVADLVLPAVSGYASTALTGLSHNATRWTFNSFDFPKYAFVSAPTGVVICKRNGASPANTDGIICYSDFNNSLEQAIQLSIGTYVVNLQFTSNGAINFSYRNQYLSGAYANTESVPKGIIHLIGSKNNTVAFTNPFNSSTATCIFSGILTGAEWLTNRSPTVFTNSMSRCALDFGIYFVKVGTLGFFNNISMTGTIELWGANNLPVFNSTYIDTSSNWSLLGSAINPTSGWNFISSANNNYWQYLKLITSDGSFLLSSTEIELYSSSVLSPTVNFT
jgi:hypothetical protein